MPHDSTAWFGQRKTKQFEHWHWTNRSYVWRTKESSSHGKNGAFVVEARYRFDSFAEHLAVKVLLATTLFSKVRNDATTALRRTKKLFHIQAVGMLASFSHDDLNCHLQLLPAQKPSLAFSSNSKSRDRPLEL